MSTCSTVQLTLPHLDVGSRKIRFIYLSSPTSFRFTECPKKDPTVPLYLGADVFSNTDIRTENHPRYHAKFAKKGLATKLQFSSAFRFNGLKVSTANNNLWFYSIQGLFRVAFEIYSMQEQVAVLENCQDQWKSRINDSPLKMCYSISVQLDTATCNSFIKICDRNRDKLVSHPQHDEVVKKLVDISQIDTGSSCDTSVDHDYCSALEGDLQTQPCSLISSTLKNLQSLEEKLNSQSQGCIDKLENVNLVVRYIDKYIDGTLDERDLTETVLALLEARNWGSVYSSHLLNSISRWLGQQFHQANSSISQQVEGFKVQHIERISDLPPAEELATKLFPEAMQTLLFHWMGLSDESTLGKRHSEYPILLLILEFANHNLITGVAHVLYSSLICK